MTIEVPLWLQGGTYPARLDRAAIAAMWDEGIQEGFKVRQRGAGANMTVDIDAGAAIVAGDDQAEQGFYRVRSTATENLIGFVAATSTQRIDLVCLRINDPNAGGPAGSNATLIRVAGTESGSPVAPAVPTSAIPLAQIGPFTTTTSSITDAMISSLRVWAGERCTPGTQQESAAAAEPSGWLLCDGRAISRTTFARLFDRISTVYGVGDGSTTFNLPDLRGRSPVGLANMGTAAGNASGDGRIAATQGGTGGNTQLPSHTHGIDHDHAAVTTSNESNFHTHGAGTLGTASDGAHTLPRDRHGEASHGHAAASSSSPFASAPFPSGLLTTAYDVAAHTHAVTGSTGNNSLLHTHTVELPNFVGTSGSTGTGTAGNVHPYAGVYVLIRT